MHQQLRRLSKHLAHIRRQIEQLLSDCLQWVTFRLALWNPQLLAKWPWAEILWTSWMFTTLFVSIIIPAESQPSVYLSVASYNRCHSLFCSWLKSFSSPCNSMPTLSPCLQILWPNHIRHPNHVNTCSRFRVENDVVQKYQQVKDYNAYKSGMGFIVPWSKVHLQNGVDKQASVC